MPRVLLITPPMVQINTPYPATPYLMGFLKRHGHEVSQWDASLELFLRLFSRRGLQALVQALEKGPKNQTDTVKSFLSQKALYFSRIDSVVRFLQGKEENLKYRLEIEGFLPQGPRFNVLNEWQEMEAEGLDWAFGSLGQRDRALFFASLFIDDIADAIREGVDEGFGLSRYGEKLAASAVSFGPIEKKLKSQATYLDLILDEMVLEHIQAAPEVVGFTVPFPGNLYAAFRMAQQIKKRFPQVKTVLGGGYVNTELREIKEPKIFEYFDYVTLDDGEGPFLSLLENIRQPQVLLQRTWVKEGGKPVYKNTGLKKVPFSECVPTYEGLALKEYVSLFEMLNPMHRLWSDGRWNKLIMAHGCYWKRCSFCDISLDYISRYEPQSGVEVVNKIETLIQQTGNLGFHFVDEAMPPKVMVSMAQEILKRGLVLSWWGNIRFEKSFTPEVAELLAESGCIALTGGLEVASDRLLKKMQKGVTVEQVARVTRAFSEKGILVHAYLMYGFPSQTEQEIVDSLEYVRQLFLANCLTSAFWHRFSVTAHSPVGKNPESYGITLLPKKSTFAVNDIDYIDSVGVDYDIYASGLKKGLYNYMLGIGLEEDVRTWFSSRVPKTKVSRSFIRKALNSWQTN